MLYREVENKLKNHDTQLEQNKNELNARMDTFVAVGSSTDNAETVDIRVSKDGLMFNSAGEHIRTIESGLIDLANSALKYDELSLSPLFTFNEFEMGHLDATGNPIISSTRVRSADFFMYNGTLTIINRNNLYKIMLIKYNLDGSYKTGIAWSSDEVIRYTLTDTEKYKFLLGKNDNTKVTLDEIKKSFFITPNNGELNKKIIKNIKTNDIDYDRRTRIGESCNIIIPNNSYYQYPNLDLVNKRVVFYRDTILILGKKMKVLMPDSGNVEVSFADIGSSAIKIYYNFNTDNFEVMNYATFPTDENCALVCSIRTDKANFGYMSIKSPYTVNGKIPYDLSNYALKTDVRNSFNSYCKSIAHQGYNRYYPNHSLLAYKEAKKHGFQYVECDVQWTLDGIPVLCHDTTIDSTSNGTGTITQMTYEQLLQYDFGSWKGESFKGTKIATFYEYINICKLYGLNAYVEIKNGQTRERIQGLIDYLRKVNMVSKVTFICNSGEVLNVVKTYSPTSRLGYVVYTFNEEYIAYCKNTLKTIDNEVFIDLAYAQYNETALIKCRENGIGLELWTTNDTVKILELAPYVDGIASDYYTVEDCL